MGGKGARGKGLGYGTTNPITINGHGDTGARGKGQPSPLTNHHHENGKSYASIQTKTTPPY